MFDRRQTQTYKIVSVYICIYDVVKRRVVTILYSIWNYEK